MLHRALPSTSRIQFASSTARTCVPLCVVGLVALAQVAHADDLPLTPRSEWRASSSAAEVPATASALAIDGDTNTHWGGAFTSEQWLQVDLGKPASIGGVLLHWDSRNGHRHSDFAASYRVLTSTDGRAWKTVFETNDGQGDLDYVFFPAENARYVRVAARPLSADWGISLFEIEPLPTTR